MAGDAHAPVLVGSGQVSARGESDPTPLGLMAEAARRALEDTGAADALRDRIDSLAVPYTFSWPLEDPARLLAAELGIVPGETVRSGTGGTAPHTLLADACERIQAGRLDVVLISGGEAINPFMQAMREGRDPGFGAEPEGAQPDRMLAADPAEPGHPSEITAGLIAPISYYPLLEHVIRHRAGRSVAEHRRWIGRLWARIGEAAGSNPYAWSPERRSAEEIATPSEANRMAMHPYTKLMTANIQVDQGAALVVCSQRAADAAGVPAGDRVFVRSTAYATDHWYPGERDRLDRSPAIAACAAAALPHAAAGIEEIEHLDIYSCFPAAVEVAATELGIDLETEARPLSVTGGLTFAGGPANNYCTHSLAAIRETIRDRGGHGLATAVGWYMTKHALAVLSADPPERPFAHFDTQDAVDGGARRRIAEQPSARAAIETYTATYDREGTATLGIVTAILEDGSRAFAKSGRPETIARLLEADPIGAEATLAGDGFEL